jgi:hypothetical protein
MVRSTTKETKMTDSYIGVNDGKCQSFVGPDAVNYPDGEVRSHSAVTLTDNQRRAVVAEQNRVFGKKTKANGFEFRSGLRVKI